MTTGDSHSNIMGLMTSERGGGSKQAARRIEGGWDTKRRRTRTRQSLKRIGLHSREERYALKESFYVVVGGDGGGSPPIRGRCLRAKGGDAKTE